MYKVTLLPDAEESIKNLDPKNGNKILKKGQVSENLTLYLSGIKFM